MYWEIKWILCRYLIFLYKEKHSQRISVSGMKAERSSNISLHSNIEACIRIINTQPFQMKEVIREIDSLVWWDLSLNYIIIVHIKSKDIVCRYGFSVFHQTERDLSIRWRLYKHCIYLVSCYFSLILYWFKESEIDTLN